MICDKGLSLSLLSLQHQACSLPVAHLLNLVIKHTLEKLDGTNRTPHLDTARAQVRRVVEFFNKSTKEHIRGAVDADGPSEQPLKLVKEVLNSKCGTFVLTIRKRRSEMCS